jgi:2,3-bisphosphoglycerate-dependent phosphoglycerate mutase
LTHLYLVRHAHSVYTPDELGRPLSERGFLDALRVTELLKKEPIDLVISSPYKRAIQTIEGTASHFQQEILLMEGLKERELSSGFVEDFGAAITKVWEDFDFALEGGESSRSAQVRGVATVNEILETYPGKHIVVGTHGNLMALMMNHFDQRYDFEFWKKLEMPDIYRLTFDRNILVGVNRVWSNT